MNRLLEQLEIKLPVIQAPMAGVSTPSMAAAVSNAGGLGSIGVGSSSVSAAREMISATRSLTKQSFNVNVFCHQPAVADMNRESQWLSFLAPHFKRFNAEPPKHLSEIYKSFVEDDEMLEAFLDLRPKVVSFHFGLPSQQKIDRLKEREIVLLSTATNLTEALEAQRAGIDAVVAQGYEAGGHRGTFYPMHHDDQLGTFALTRLLVTTLDIPVIAAGGIMDGAGIVAMLHLGAEAAQLGTAFIGCPESSADQFYRAALQSEAAMHTTMTSAISGREARCLANLFTAIGNETDPSAIPSYPIAYDAGKALNAAARKAGEGGFGAQWAGQGAPLCRPIPVAELMLILQEEMVSAKTLE
jgi:nitronate monooxygenase